MGNNPRETRKISQLAGRQYGHVTRAQLLELGVGSKAIDHRVRTGRLVRVHAGVYAVEYRRPEPIARAAAAVLASGPTALLSHDSAAALWDLRRWPAVPEVTVTTDRRPPGIGVHRSRTLTRRHLTHQLGIRVTSPARTLGDIRARLSRDRYARLVNDARLKRLVSADEAESLLGQRHGPTRSAFEDAFPAFLRRHRLPEAQVNASVNGYEVDALFAAHKLIVELDGYEFHSGRYAFERDRERDAALLAAGYATVRITWERLHDQPRREASRLREILRSRRSSG